MQSPSPATPDLETLVNMFYSDMEQLAKFEERTASQLPAIYQQLLAHHAHMTVTVESYHGCPVTVQVLQARHVDGFYEREILLHRSDNGAPVQYGIVRLDIQWLPEEALRRIINQEAPLGRILIENNVLREVQLSTLWEVKPTPHLATLLGCSTEDVTYGRTALLFCNGEPAIELLEIVAPA